jgi:hypothetical protein
MRRLAAPPGLAFVGSGGSGADKGKRDELVKLHSVVADHLPKLAGFSPVAFARNHNERTLYTQFARIQEAAKIKLPCDREHKHTRYCHLYGFHDLRRTFATISADKLTRTRCRPSCGTRATRRRNGT